MRVLVVGGSGLVSTLVLPILVQHHEVRVFDLRPPSLPLDYVEGNIGDLAALRGAAAGMDALLFMAMGSKVFDAPDAISSNFDVSVKGVYLALLAAHEAGIEHAVYTSSMSVYEGDITARSLNDEDIAPDATHFYGITKRLGEEMCRHAVAHWKMSVNALRLCHPRSDEEWQDETDPAVPTIATPASDVARAILAALDLRGQGFQAFTISGDYNQTFFDMGKARRMLGWEPMLRPRTTDHGPQTTGDATK